MALHADAGAPPSDPSPTGTPSPTDAPPTSDAGPGPTVSRITAADRYDLGAELARRVSPGSSNTVYLASGATFPDALSAGPAAVASSAPLLLVAPDSVPSSVAASLIRLDPRVVKVVGGPATVSDAVLATVHALVPSATVSRIWGADRYAVSREVVADAFGAGASGAGVATGRDFPDALALGAVAGASSLPVILVDGAAPAADSATRTLLHGLGVHVATVVGGPLSVSDGVLNTLLPDGWVPRVSGANRYEVSVNLATAFATNYSTVYLVTGANFPDALAGGVLAAKTISPMFVVPGDCVPRGVLSLIATNGTSNVTLIGGPASLSPAVAALTPCSF